MPSAFVLITTESGSENLVLDQLKTISGIRQASMVYGVYDIIVQISDKSLDTIKNNILTEIRKINFVRSSITLLLFENEHVMNSSIFHF